MLSSLRPRRHSIWPWSRPWGLPFRHALRLLPWRLLRWLVSAAPASARPPAASARRTGPTSSSSKLKDEVLRLQSETRSPRRARRRDGKRGRRATQHSERARRWAEPELQMTTVSRPETQGRARPARTPRTRSMRRRGDRFSARARERTPARVLVIQGEGKTIETRDAAGIACRREDGTRSPPSSKASKSDQGDAKASQPRRPPAEPK